MSINEVSLNTWNGDPNSFYATNLNNFKAITNFIDEWNEQSLTNDYLIKINITLDVSDYDVTNRNAYQQFVENAKKINALLDEYIVIYQMKNQQYIYKTAAIPSDTDFNRINLNTYWQTINNHINFIISEVNAY